MYPCTPLHPPAPYGNPLHPTVPPCTLLLPPAPPAPPHPPAPSCTPLYSPVPLHPVPFLHPPAPSTMLSRYTGSDVRVRDVTVHMAIALEGYSWSNSDNIPLVVEMNLQQCKLSDQETNSPLTIPPCTPCTTTPGNLCELAEKKFGAIGAMVLLEAAIDSHCR